MFQCMISLCITLLCYGIIIQGLQEIKPEDSLLLQATLGDQHLSPSIAGGSDPTKVTESSSQSVIQLSSSDTLSNSESNTLTLPQSPITESLSDTISLSDIEIVDAAAIGETVSLETEDINVGVGNGSINESNAREKLEAREEDIETFNEWAKQKLAEAEQKEKFGGNINITTSSAAPAKIQSMHKIRAKNYASPDCGAKVLIANPEAQNPWAVLSSSRDEYLLNICKAKLWLVVELCEAVKVEKVDLANFELFSSSPKEFVVSLSDRYPTRDWIIVGKHIALDERSIQSFSLDQHQFGKFIKLEVLSHYESEHFCPLSLFHVYGTSEYEVLETEGSSTNGLDSITEDEEIEGASEYSADLFGSAKEAVMSIVKKAANVFTKDTSNEEILDDSLKDKFYDGPCSTLVYPHFVSPSILPVFSPYSGEINRLLSCRAEELSLELQRSKKLHSVLVRTSLCKFYQTIWMLTNLSSPSNCCHADSLSLFYFTFYGAPYIGALCVLKCNIPHLFTATVISPSTADSLTTNISVEPDNSYVTSTGFSSTISIMPSVTKTASPEPVITSAPVLHSNMDIIKPSKASVDHIESISSSSSHGDEIGNTDSTTFNESGGVVLQDSLVINDDNDFILIEESLDSYSKTDDKNNTNMTDIYLEDNLGQFNDIHGNTSWGNDSSSQPTLTPNVPKETVFLRLSNKIKALELNLSLSSQYLEQLSRSYKDLKRSFNYTVGRIDDIDSNQTRLLTQLSIALANLTMFINNLSTNQDDLKGWVIQTHVLLMFLEIILLFILFGFCIKTSRGGITISYPEFGDNIQYLNVEDGAPNNSDWENSIGRKVELIDGKDHMDSPYLFEEEQHMKKKKSKKKRKPPSIVRSKSNGALFDQNELYELTENAANMDGRMSLPSTGVLFGSTDALKFAHTCATSSLSNGSVTRNVQSKSSKMCDKEANSTEHHGNLNASCLNGNILSMDSITAERRVSGEVKIKKKKLPSFKKIRKSSSDVMPSRLHPIVTFQETPQDKLSTSRKKKNFWDLFRKSK